MLYTSLQLPISKHPSSVIPTEPQISQLQAIEIVEQHLRKEVSDLEDARLYFSLYNFTEERFGSDPDYERYISTVARGGWSFSHIKTEPELLQLPLFFVHANGTQYAINATDNTYQMRCLKAPNRNSCAFPEDAAYAVCDRLVYRIESYWHPPAIASSSVSVSFGNHIIDAETGELVWNSIDYQRSRSLLAAAPNLDYEGHISIKERIREKLNPPETLQIVILEGASDERQERSFMPSKARAVETISNKVVWTNKDATAHTVRSDEAYSNPYTDDFNSALIEPNESYEYTFIEVGEYPYHCEIHPWMKGEVDIVENFA